jgi:hypothetical protein
LIEASQRGALKVMRKRAYPNGKTPLKAVIEVVA